MFEGGEPKRLTSAKRNGVIRPV